ncbi:MAG: PAS domain S-box protein, partial [Desulfobacterales bacterium]
TKIEYLTFYLGVPVFTEYFRTVFPKECSKRAIYIISIIGVLFSVTVLLTTAKLYTHTAPLFQIFSILAAGYGFYVLFLALKHKRQEALVFLVGFVILFLTLVNDILYSNLLVKTGHMIQFGLFVFIFSQAFLLSLRFSKSFSTVEVQGGILKAINASYQKEIIERMRTEKSLRESEERYRTLFEQVPDAIFLEDLKDNIIDGNPGTCRLTGFTRGELLNMRIADLQAPEVRGKNGNVVKSELEKYQGEPFEGLYLQKSGTHIPVEIKTVPLTQEGWVLSIVRDISERKRAEQEKIKLTVQLHQVQKMEAIATLAGGIAHQFNNALSVVGGNIELLCLEAPENEKIDKFIGPIRHQIRRMSQLTDQLLAYARGGKYQVEEISIGDFISNTLPLIQYNIKSTIGVETDIPHNIFRIKADLTQMQMVMSAIITNASEALDSTGCIRIISRNIKIIEKNAKDFGELKPGPYVNLTIEDDGKGMNEETRKRIFEPFFTTKFQGRGLGMAAAYGVIKNHGGWISIASELNKGTTVRFYLPAI